VAVKADLSGGSTEIVVGVVVLITSAIKIIKELVVFIGCKASDLEVFGVAIAERVGINVEVVGQQ
jgi:hypothetical protein